MNTSTENVYITVAKKLRLKFEQIVIPRNVLPVFHTYDDTILTQGDIEAVKATVYSKGDIEGAGHLFDILIRYPGWYTCLLKVLRNQYVKLSHLADLFEQTKDDVQRGGSISPVNDENPLIRKISIDSKCETPEHEEPESDFKLDISRPKEADTVQNLKPNVPPSTPNKNVQIATGIVSDGTKEEESSDDNNNIDQQYENGSASLSWRSTAIHKCKVTSNKPERDFSKDEAISGMKRLPGYHPDITERDILTKLNPNTAKDGHFILWYWEAKKRPAICVMHNGEIKTLLVHKKPDLYDKTKVSYYFINKHEHTNKYLKDLLKMHIDNGVMDMTQSGVTISFSKGVKP